MAMRWLIPGRITSPSGLSDIPRSLPNTVFCITRDVTKAMMGFLSRRWAWASLKRSRTFLLAITSRGDGVTGRRDRFEQAGRLRREQVRRDDASGELLARRGSDGAVGKAPVAGIVDGRVQVAQIA